jgi:hypothetical protein
VWQTKRGWFHHTVLSRLRRKCPEGCDKGEKMGTSLLSIDFDVETYLERGGRLLDLEMILSASDRAVIEAKADTMSQATLNRLARVGRFLTRVGELLAEDDAKVGKTLTEDQLRSIWRGAAPAVSDTPQ